MIVDKTYNLKLSAPVSYINKVWPAFNDSFVLEAEDNSRSMILHLDCEGK
jgi:hypothetical protein